jgi:hypothetical protein
VDVEGRVGVTRVASAVVVKAFGCDDFSSWAGPGLLGTRTLHYASKTVWMLSDNEVASNSLMEADLNCSTKMVFGIRMLNEARRQNLMPEEVFSERNKMADDGTLTKVLTYDIIRQTRRSAGLASVDADNCYDRIAHAIASLVFQAFGVPLSASEAMLTTIQEMKFFLRTGFGDSTDLASSTLSIKTR